MSKFILHFIDDGSEIQLSRTEFSHPINSHKRISIRGKNSGAFYGVGTFGWSPGVKGLCKLLCNAKIRAMQETREGEYQPHLQGMHRSMASALDSAIYKQCSWLEEMFGTDSEGRLLVVRLLRRSNSCLKLGGPVSLSLNSHFMDPLTISIFVNGVEADDVVKLSDMALAIGGDAEYAVSNIYIPCVNNKVHEFEAQNYHKIDI